MAWGGGISEYFGLGGDPSALDDLRENRLVESGTKVLGALGDAIMAIPLIGAIPGASMKAMAKSLQVYHGTPGAIEGVFDSAKLMANAKRGNTDLGKGLYLSTDPNRASGYAMTRAIDKETQSKYTTSGQTDVVVDPLKYPEKQDILSQGESGANVLPLFIDEDTLFHATQYNMLRQPDGDVLYTQGGNTYTTKELSDQGYTGIKDMRNREGSPNHQIMIFPEHLDKVFSILTGESMGAKIAERYKPQFTSNILEKLGNKETYSLQQLRELRANKSTTTQEGNAIDRALEAVDTSGKKINADQFRMAFDDQILPLETSTTSSYADYDISNEIVPNVLPHLVVTDEYTLFMRQNPNMSPVESQIAFNAEKGGRPVTKLYKSEGLGDTVQANNHFDEPDYVAHTRSADFPGTQNIQPDSPITDFDYNKPNIGGYREVYELQSDLFQKEIKGQEYYFDDTPESDLGFRSIDPSLADQQKQWYKRIAREEIKDAQTKGLDYVDFPTGDTAARIEGWYRQIPNANDYIPNLTRTQFNDLELNVRDYLNGRTINYTAIQTFKEIFGLADETEVISMLSENNPTQLWHIFNETRAVINAGITTKTIPDEFKGLFKFYEKDLSNFLNKNYDMERITKGNKDNPVDTVEQAIAHSRKTEDSPKTTSWWRVKVPKGKGPISIPAIGGAAVLGGAAIKSQGDENNGT